MARENRRKQHERRFGKPERLADLVVSTPPKFWGLIPRTSGAEAVIHMLREELPGIPVIDASNVMDYYARHEKVEWDFVEDTPCAAPPFPEFWVEMRCPEVVRTAAGLEPSTPDSPDVSGGRRPGRGA